MPQAPGRLLAQDLSPLRPAPAIRLLFQHGAEAEAGAELPITALREEVRAAALPKE